MKQIKHVPMIPFSSHSNEFFVFCVSGACNTAGRVIAGCLSFAPKISPLLVNNICITLAGVAVILTPFCTSFVSMAIAIAGYGFFCCKSL